jgi:hypothetical protein
MKPAFRFLKGEKGIQGTVARQFCQTFKGKQSYPFQSPPTPSKNATLQILQSGLLMGNH